MRQYLYIFVMVNICAKKQSGSLKLTKTEEQVIADTDHEIELLEDVFASNLMKMELKRSKLKRSRSYPLPLSTTRKNKNQALVAENGVLNQEVSYLKSQMIQTCNDRVALNDIGKCF